MATAPGFPEFLVAWVKTQPDLLALLGGADQLRVSPWQAVRKDDAPRVTHTLVSGIDGGVVQLLSGPGGTARQRWQLDCWGPRPEDARQLARLLCGAPGEPRLIGFGPRRPDYPGALGGVAVQSLTLADLRDDSEPMGPASDQGNPCVSVFVDVAYRIV